MKKTTVIMLLVATIGLGGWPSTDFSNLGKSLVNSTGVVNSNQVDSLLKAGGKLNEAAKGLTDEQEYYLGRGVSAMILKQYPLYQSKPNLTKYLNLVGGTLAARCVRPETFGGYHFNILDTDEINALSAPGGFVYVSRGFLATIPNEEALAGVLAHEIGHIVLGHGVKAISQARLSEGLLILGKEAAASYGPKELTQATEVFGDSVNQVFDTLIKNGYSRSQEYEADDFAAKLMAKAGYSATGLSTMLDQLAALSGKTRGGWMDTHPSPKDRKSSMHLPKQTADQGAVQIRAARYQKQSN